MSNRITNSELYAAAARYQLALANAGMGVTGLRLIMGSKTYGNSYRYVYVDPETGGQTRAPGAGHSNGFIGWTKREAHDTLHAMARVLEDVNYQRELNYIAYEGL